MKKRLSVLAVTACIILAIFALAGCKKNSGPASDPSSPDNTPAAAADANAAEGEYKLYAIGNEGVYFSVEEYGKLFESMMASLADSFDVDEDQKSEIQGSVNFSDSLLTLNKDGTAKLAIFGTSSDCTWTKQNGNITISVPETEDTDASEITGTIDKGIIRLTDPEEGAELVFAAAGADTSGIPLTAIQDLFSQN